jgi:hypothetical protein
MRLYDLTRTTLVLASMFGLLGAQAGCNGDDGGSGGFPFPTATPTSGGGIPTPTPTAVIVDTAGANLGDIIKGYPNGGRFIISPGTYGPIALTDSDVTGPLTLQADETGAFTGRGGTITILAQDKRAAIDLDGLDDVVIEGVSTVGGTRAGILIANGEQIVLLHNKVRQATGDGIRIQLSSAVLVFNNLLYNNQGTGLTARGVNTMEAVNNTVFGNGSGGISYLRQQFEGGSDGSPFGFVLNNIIDSNAVYGLRVDDDSQFEFTGNYNLNNDGYVGVEPGNRDLSADPLFVFPNGGNFFLQANVGVGGSPAIDRGDPNTEEFFVESLRERTTREDLYRDVPPVDLGYHYPGGIDTPTPVPSFTPRGTQQRPTNTPTATPTRTPTGTPVATSAGQSRPAANGSSDAGGPAGGSVAVPTPTATATPVPASAD